MHVDSLAADLDTVTGDLGTREAFRRAVVHGHEFTDLHGAVASCAGLQPGSEPVLRAVMRAHGVTEDWTSAPDLSEDVAVGRMRSLQITEDALERTFGPCWSAILSLIDRAARLTYNDSERVSDTWDGLTAAGRGTAHIAAWEAIENAGRRDQYEAASWAARSAAARSMHGSNWSSVFSAADSAVMAIYVHDLIEDDGLSLEQYGELLSAWVFGLDADHTDGTI